MPDFKGSVETTSAPASLPSSPRETFNFTSGGAGGASMDIDYYNKNVRPVQYGGNTSAYTPKTPQQQLGAEKTQEMKDINAREQDAARKGGLTNNDTQDTQPTDVRDNSEKGYNGSTVQDDANNDRSSQSVNTELFKIGRIHRLSQDVDPDGRIVNYLRSKMTIIDLLPCTYKLEMSKMDANEGVSGFLPQIIYDEVQKEFSEQCRSYGLKTYAGLRIFTTDETVSAETISHDRGDNVFENAVNSAFDSAQAIRTIGQSMSPQTMNDLTKYSQEQLIPQIEGGLGKIAGELGTSGDTSSFIKGFGALAKMGVDAVLGGRRVAFPSIWTNSSYMPNLSASIRLCSPYGHPAAIKEFIIRPLIYLLILTAPKTKDGVSFGQPYTMTIHAYGMSYNPLGYIRNVSIRRGGNDTSFNLYRQPLTVDVTLDFDYLVKGFGAFEGNDNKDEKDRNIFDDSDRWLDDPNYSDGDRTCIPTLGHIVRSLRPLKNPHGSPTGVSGDSRQVSANENQQPPSQNLAQGQEDSATTKQASDSAKNNMGSAGKNSNASSSSSSGYTMLTSGYNQSSSQPIFKSNNSAAYDLPSNSSFA